MHLLMMNQQPDRKGSPNRENVAKGSLKQMLKKVFFIERLYKILQNSASHAFT